jgi:hypothetical protein
MSQNKQKIRHLSNCNVSTSVPEGAVVMSASSPEMSLRKKKEEARKELYITRI